VCGPGHFLPSQWDRWIWLSEFVFLVILSEETIAICRQGLSTFVVHFFFNFVMLLKCQTTSFAKFANLLKFEFQFNIFFMISTNT